MTQQIMTAPRPDPRPHLPALPVEHLADPATRGRRSDPGPDARRRPAAVCVSCGFVELLPPIIGPVTDPGGRGSKQVDIDYYGHRYKLMTSAILYKQAALTAFDKIFCVAPNVRLEPPETRWTGRHLAEFHQIDVEIAGASRDDAMEVAAERSRQRPYARVRHRAARPTSPTLGRDPAAFDRSARRPFDRMSHADAVEPPARADGHAQSPDAEIDWDAEKAALQGQPSGRSSSPTTRRVRAASTTGRAGPIPGTLRNFDLIAPDGLRRAGQRQRARIRLPPDRRPDPGDRREPREVRRGTCRWRGTGIPAERRLRPRRAAADPLPRRPGLASGRPAPSRSCRGCSRA